MSVAVCLWLYELQPAILSYEDWSYDFLDNWSFMANEQNHALFTWFKSAQRQTDEVFKGCGNLNFSSVLNCNYYIVYVKNTDQRFVVSIMFSLFGWGMCSVPGKGTNIRWGKRGTVVFNPLIGPSQNDKPIFHVRNRLFSYFSIYLGGWSKLYFCTSWIHYCCRLFHSTGLIQLNSEAVQYLIHGFSWILPTFFCWCQISECPLLHTPLSSLNTWIKKMWLYLSTAAKSRHVYLTNVWISDAYHKWTLEGAHTNEMGLFYIDYTDQEDCILRVEEVMTSLSSINM